MALVATLVCSMALLMSCSDNDDAPDHEGSAVAECTVIFYGNGGGNLDADMHENLRQYTKDYVTIVRWRQ